MQLTHRRMFRSDSQSSLVDIFVFRLFGSLADDKSPSLTYNRDMADQRRKYGEGMLRKSAEHLAAQEKHEADMKARLENARQQRADEKHRQDEIEVSPSITSFFAFL